MDSTPTEELPLTIENYPPTVLGPTWRRDAEGQFIRPKHTLGWQAAGWVHEYVLDPNSDAHDPTPWRFTNEQLRLLLWWYAIDEHGEFIYRQGVIQRMKGHGKDPLLAVICLIELCGPSRFSHWDEDGRPVGKPHPAPWVQVAAVSREQTKNTMRMFPHIISDKLKAEHGLDVGIEFIRTAGAKGNLEAVTSNPRSLEGGRVTFALLNETHHWVQGNSGIEMYLTADNNAAKLGNRYLAITNAYVPGEDSAAERMRIAYERILEGLDEDLGFMYDSLEAHESIPLTKEGLRFAIPIIRGDSVWCKPDNVIPSALRGDMPPARARRMYLNQIVAGDDKLWTEADIKANKVDDILRAGDKIVLGFDGGKSDDATALIAIRVDDGFIQPLLVEEKPTAARAKGWEVSHEKVNSVVSEAFRLYQVQGFYADVHLWEDDLIDWTASYGPGLLVRSTADRPIHWDMRGGPAGGGQSRKVIYAHEALISNWNARSLRHRGGQDPLTASLRRHMLNAVRRDGDFGVGFSKESPESPKKIDAYSALVLANAALNDYRAKDKGKPKTGRGWWI